MADKGKHKTIPAVVAVAAMVLGVGWALDKRTQVGDGEVAVRILVNTTADHERVADVEYIINQVHDTQEDARLEWGKTFAVEEGAIVGVNGTKQGGDNPDAVFYCEIWVNDRLAMRAEADDNNEITEDPPFVNCEVAAL